ncbi:hypothetical protein PIB30_079560 [Stylosanthes scabra]|uniref:Uncharacterized protein n=1 Tax=Stylosanthes scabra TaxID=79078 RepID=A0ABU6TSJ6_9FABA|nr:hypothetical protein [Stylosanthes scabra]
MTRGGRGRGRGDRGRGTGHRGWPKKRTDIPLDLGEPVAGTSAPTPVPVVPTPSPAEGGPTIRMIPIPGSSRVHSSSDTTGTRSQKQNSAQTSGDHDDDGPPQAPQTRCRGHRLTLLCRRGRGRTSPWRRSSPGRLVVSTSTGMVVTVGIRYGRAQPRSPGSSTITTGSLCPSSVWPVMRWSIFSGTVGGAGMRAGSIPLGGREPPRDSKLKEVNKQNRASSTGGSLHTGGSTMYEATRDSMTAELGRTPTHSEVFARTHTRKEDQLWVDKRSADVNGSFRFHKISFILSYSCVARTNHIFFSGGFLAELKRLQAERQALMEAGCPEPPPIDEAAPWTRFAGGRKRGRIYGMGVVPSHQHPLLFPDDEDADTASGPPDLRERVVLLNREISQQAEANARRVAALESTVQTQSQEVSELRKAYADMYSLLTQMRSGGSTSAPLPDFPPPPPPPPPPQTDSPGTGSPDADDDPDYV